MRQQVIEIENAIAFFSAQVAGGEQTAEPAPGRAIARIGEDVRRAVSKDESRAGVIAQRQFFLALDEMRAHHTGNRVAVAQPQACKFKMIGLKHQFLGMRGATQKRKVRGDCELDVTGESLAFHWNVHLYTQQARRLANSGLRIRERNSRKLMRMLERDGWVLDRVNGDHHTFKHPRSAVLITITHPRRDLPIGLVRRIYKLAGWRP